MAILYPLILVPAYFASDGSPEIFYATTSAVLGGAVAGDHVSPISDTTVISALACDVTLMQHVVTQAPYVFVVVIFAIVSPWDTTRTQTLLVSCWVGLQYSYTYTYFVFPLSIRRAVGIRSLRYYAVELMNYKPFRTIASKKVMVKR